MNFVILIDINNIKLMKVDIIEMNSLKDSINL